MSTEFCAAGACITVASHHKTFRLDQATTCLESPINASIFKGGAMSCLDYPSSRLPKGLLRHANYPRKVGS